MMRKGPIERYSVSDTLRTAAAEGRSGTISVSSRTSGAIYLEKGYVYFATLDGVPTPVDMSPSDRPPKEAVRRWVESVLCVLVEQHDGWYEYDPLGRHPDGVRWVFGVDGLEAAVRSRLAEDAPLRRWSGTPVELGSAPSAFVRVSADMWAVAMAMASPTSSHDLRDRLGWEPERLALALGQMGQVGVLADEPPLEEVVAPALPVVDDRATEPVAAHVTNGSAVRHSPDVVPRPLLTFRPVPERQPVGVAVGASGADPTATLRTYDEPESEPEPPEHDEINTEHRSAPVPATVASPAAAGPPAVGSNRKSALKRLISSLRQ